MKQDTPGAVRRRGAALEDALLRAAWDELLETGYAGFTIEGVAERAQTSRPVLYRRWPNRSDLVIAAIAHYGAIDAVTVPDTGNLRDDLVEFMRAVSVKRAELAVLFSVQMGQYYTEMKSSMADVRDHLVRGRPLTSDEIMRRGVERGEIDPAKLTPRIATLPFDLLRHELMMTLQPVPDQVIVEIVDTIFLPLVAP